MKAIGRAGQEGPAIGLGKKLGMALRTIIVRGLLLMFYLVFLILFVGFQVTGDGHAM